MATYETLLIHRPSPHIEVVTLNRPQALNATNTQAGRELLRYWRAFDLYEEPDRRAIVLTGAGEKSFCVGADLKERQGMDDIAWKRQHEIFRAGRDAMLRIPIPIIGAINGHALGGGCELALLCDLIVASETATFGLPEIKLGIMPGMGGTQRLPRRIGAARAKDMILTGRTVRAPEALAWGLVDRLVEPGYLMDEAVALATLISENAPISLRQAKKSIDRSLDLTLEAGFALEIECYNLLVASEDRREGVNAFNEKRKPQFRNR
jgi:enoyl-CoA hydratase/carnithine racemase